MNRVKTAKGRVIDMQALAKANEEIRAVTPGNNSLNARGDDIDRAGNVIRTVQAKSRVARDTTSGPEKRRLSDAPSATKAKIKETVESREKRKADPAPAMNDPLVVREEEKERDDGTKYLETEFEDGSIETTEIKGNE